MTRPSDRAAAVICLTLIVAIGAASPVGAQQEGSSVLGIDEQALLGAPAGPPLEGEALNAATMEVATKLRCPVCQGLSVADSPSASALAMLEQIRDLVAAGYSRDQIFDYFESSYGEFVRLQPRADGLNLVVWIGPVAIIAVGIWLLGRRRSTAPVTADDEDEELAPYLQQVRSELGSAAETEA